MTKTITITVTAEDAASIRQILEANILAHRPSTGILEHILAEYLNRL